MSRERGATLIVSLIVLLVLTLIGVAGMNTSVMQERMAVNSQNSNRAFQAAESTVRSLMDDVYANDLTVLRQSMQNSSGKSDRTNITIDPGNGVSGSYQARYLGEVIITSGSSMDANESSNQLKGFRYELEGEASVANTGASARVFKGIEYY
ncbi:PilX N-terminal domain-containing pilus assembly protein [Marinobacter sp. M216]|uniref:PilX N-terminal domain-containing pilus assembly protein n=1 Tax=Marinobacter albus TaxID=3030833 RepID=A0ABT7HGJ7_9GAMM|nr:MULTISPECIES: PilX N-terminal domain-containing pilus assembly protein [unclassified Marinobacter]MBW7473099.1 PilX protein [Marinobacter sp. F4218]MDK9559508.1 PilX N-terminal domain-containing pilus assembly protein [Marinobacter sp. M216]